MTDNRAAFGVRRSALAGDEPTSDFPANLNSGRAETPTDARDASTPNAEHRTPNAVCEHCGQPIPAGLTRFCCSGCAAAAELLRSCDLGEFYRLRDGEGLPAASADFADYDTVGFADAHVVPRADGSAQVTWYVQGMHCPACVWLLERLPRLDDGVRTSRVQFGLGRLHTTFDPTRTTPGAIARLAARLGYRLRPWRERGAVAAEKRDLFLRCAVAGAAAVAAMHLSMNLYAGELAQDLNQSDAMLFGWMAVALAGPAAAWAAQPFWRAAAAALTRGRLGLDATAVLVVVVGTAASIANLLRGSREIYIDAVAMFVALLLLGRVTLLAAREKVLAASGALDHLLPSMARRADGVSVPTSALVPGEIVAVHAGEVLPCDGVVVSEDHATPAQNTFQHSNIPTFGISSAVIDQAVLTGESRPMTVDVGGLVHAGTTCRSARVRVRVTATGDATRVGALLAGVTADSGRPLRTTPWLDRLVAWWAPLTMAIAGSAWVVWAWHGQAARGLDQAVALILVACPCALGLAAPLTQAVAVSRAARRGLLVRDAGALDALAGGTLAHAVFDKTGTLTEGRMRVVAWDWLSDDAALRAQLPGLVAAAEDRSQHPVALAISAHLTCARAEISDWSEMPGRGVRCRAGTMEVLIGRFADHSLASQTDHADTLVTLSLNDHALAESTPRTVAVIRLADPLRPTIAAALARLRRHGVRLHLASGDSPTVAQAVGRTLGFAHADIHGGLLPEDKAALVQRLAADGPVAMIGDGLNDAAAMAQADASIALSGGIEHALGACRIVVARRDADAALAELLDLADGVRRRTRLVLGVSLIYNVAGVALAAVGVWGPYLCAIAMPVSSLTAVLLAVMRMKHAND